MTEAQIILVKKSWRLLQQIDPQLLGGVFYDKLFTEQPALRKLFTVPIEQQSRKLIDMLSIIVRRLEDLDSLTNDISLLAKKHTAYGVKPEHYSAVGDALLWTLKQGLGIDWTPDLKEAWQASYHTLADAMVAMA